MRCGHKRNLVLRIERLHAKALVAPKDKENAGNNNFNKKWTFNFDLRTRDGAPCISSSVVHSE